MSRETDEAIVRDIKEIKDIVLVLTNPAKWQRRRNKCLPNPPTKNPVPSVDTKNQQDSLS